MNARDQLDSILAQHINFRDHEIADAPEAIIAAGWRPRPQLIDSPEGLAALPFLTLIREIRPPAPSGADYGCVWVWTRTDWPRCHCIGLRKEFGRAQRNHDGYRVDCGTGGVPGGSACAVVA